MNLQDASVDGWTLHYAPSEEADLILPDNYYGSDGVNLYAAEDFEYQLYTLTEGYTLTYTDGLPDTELFPDQTYLVAVGAELPEFEGELVNEGHVFGGWDYPDDYMPNYDLEMKARWFAAPETYAVAFDANGGTGMPFSVAVLSGGYELPPCGYGAPEGMQFKAWLLDGVEYAPGATIEVNSDLTVVALWEPDPNGSTSGSAGYYVHFAPNGGAGTPCEKAADRSRIAGV